VKTPRDGAGLHRLSALFNEGVTGVVTDGQLLERFATRGGAASELAFTALVERHGPVVMRLCRSVLRDEHEAQDAFQATFLVLAQRAESLWVRDSLGPWLHAVAYRVSSCARAAAIRRRRHERRHGELAAGRLAIYPDDDRGDLKAAIHEEIAHLPEHYRAPLVLCDLEGCTHEQAARHLGWPVGTVKSRQARGRQRLRTRLIRRGLSPSSELVLPTVFTPKPAVPADLIKATAHLATIWAGADSARVAALAGEVLKVMFLQRLKWTIVPIAMTALAIAGAGNLAWRAGAAMPGQGPAPPATPGQKPEAAAAKQERAGRIYITAEHHADPRGTGAITRSLVVLDPQTGARTDLFDGCSIRPRVSPDGKSVAFEWEDALWVRGLDPDAEPMKVLPLGGSTSGSPPVWSPDGKQLVISIGQSKGPGTRWVFTTRRGNVDSTGWEKLAIPSEDCVDDWSPDGRRLLICSQRGAENGWQLYIMRPDGTDQRRITDGGNPFGARFSPDGRRVIYADNGRGGQSGIWVVDVDGKNGRRLFPVDVQETVASACWSPDGQRIAISLRGFRSGRPPLVLVNLRVVVMDLDGGHRSEIEIASQRGHTDMPDWR
jgi:RNA polymerase sigma factor (sigma-70 family)